MKHIKQNRRWTAGCIAMLSAPLSFALGLGDSEQQSWLGEPLKASIALTEVGNLSADQIKLDLVTTDSAMTRNIKARIEGSGDAMAIVLRTPNVVREPFVDFVITVTWPEGSLQREYQLLLDPPPSN